tara:strand:+ start:318 stop:473 length:156 start_codon:yes stop_codon:yes gene_type:complete
MNTPKSILELPPKKAQSTSTPLILKRNNLNKSKQETQKGTENTFDFFSTFG